MTNPISLANLVSGRTRGSPNTHTAVRLKLNNLGFDPVTEAVKRFRDPKTPHSSKDYCLGLITDRLLPKLKAIEVRSDNAGLKAILINVIAGQPQQMIDITPEQEASADGASELDVDIVE